MTFISRFASIFCNKPHKYRKDFKYASKHTVEYKVHLLDGSCASFHLKPSSLGCDLLNQVILQLDIAERDYFSLKYEDKRKNMLWIDATKKLRKITRKMKKPYEFYFQVKFYAIDPDQLNEELTRYHFFLKAKEDVKNHRLFFNEQIMVELAALAIQSQIGDYDDVINPSDYCKEFIFMDNSTDEFISRVQAKHKELTGLTPGECEINFLKRIKMHEFYGVEFYTVKDENKFDYRLGFTPRGVKLVKDELQVGFYAWNRINMISFKKKQLRFLVHNKLDPNVIDKYNFMVSNCRMTKCIWKLAIEHHSFFRLIRTFRNYKSKRSGSGLFSSKFRYSGRTFYEASEESAKLQRQGSSLKRSRTTCYSMRSTSGYIRIGSRVMARADNGEYFKGVVIALTDKVYVKCDDGITLAHHKNSTDGIIYDAPPAEAEITIGTRVVAKWPEISNYLPGNISSIDMKESITKYMISFDDGDNHWNTVEQIRLLKPPMYFGPGSNTSYLEKKFSMLKTTSLVNSQIDKAINCAKNAIKLQTEEICEDIDAKENLNQELMPIRPRTTSTLGIPKNHVNTQNSTPCST